MNDQETARAMRRLRGETSTPSWLAKEAREIEARRLMAFDAWIGSGWHFTDQGRDFLAEIEE